MCNWNKKKNKLNSKYRSVECESVGGRAQSVVDTKIETTKTDSE